ncbi:MAG: hypothetical protein ACHREM_22650 [Polyangiales bacterium]
MTRHARLTLAPEDLDALHNLKRTRARELNRKVTLDDLLREGVQLVLRHYGALGDATTEARS